MLWDFSVVCLNAPNWDHVIDSRKLFEPTEQAYRSGVIIGMDMKEAMDFHDESGSFVEDSFASFFCEKDLQAYIFKEMREEDDDDPLMKDKDSDNELMEYARMDAGGYLFFRFTGNEIPDNLEDIAKMLRNYSFWLPEFIWYKGVFQEFPRGNVALDGDGNIVGVRF